MSDCWDEAARVDFEEGLWFLVGVDFDVLVGYAFEFQRYPDTLDEGTGGGVVSDRWARDL